jgi:hypothetical protein
MADAETENPDPSTTPEPEELDKAGSDELPAEGADGKEND